MTTTAEVTTAVMTAVSSDAPTAQSISSARRGMAAPNRIGTCSPMIRPSSAKRAGSRSFRRCEANSAYECASQ